jgi:predicted nucleic acid-binding protein
VVAGLTLDAGALIAFDRADRATVLLLARARERSQPLHVPAGVIGQVWRNGARQARLAILLASHDLQIHPLDDHTARAAGQLCGATATTDVIDAQVVLTARTRGRRVATSDPDDLRRLDPALTLIKV